MPYSLCMGDDLVFKAKRMYEGVIREIKLMSDKEPSYKIVPIAPPRDDGSMNAIQLMKLYDGLIKENAFLRERVIRLEQRLIEALN